MFVNAMRGETVTVTLTGVVLDSRQTVVSIKMADGRVIVVPKSAVEVK